LARRNNVQLEFKPIASPPAVIEAVKNGEADIGFVAYVATRLGTVEFSQTYMLVRQSFLVLDGSPIAAIADIDRAGQKIAGTVNDSITLCMKRILKHATIVELANNPAGLSKALTARTIDALGANRQRLTTLAKATPGTRLLPDDLFNVPQNIVVPNDRPTALAAVNALIDKVRVSGFLQSAIERGGAIGVAVAPAGVQAGCPG
jgi:polar amino acid transport system substrate-binding protein